jgi:hypothetical protein
MDAWTPFHRITKESIEAYTQSLNLSEETPQKGANSKQIAGSHYSDKEIQPWDFIYANNLGYFEGNCVKYVSRWKDKGGIDDLKKAIHYLEKLIELEQGK